MQRRLFFRNAAGLFLAPAAMQFAGTASAATPAVSPIELPPAEDIISSFGWVTDIHYTTAPTHTIPAEDSIRVYSHSLAKLHQAIDVFNTRKLDFAIELGDFKDCTKTVDRELTIGFLQTVESAFRRYRATATTSWATMTSTRFHSATISPTRTMRAMPTARPTMPS